MKLSNFDVLKSTFQDSIFTWDYFVDFQKVKSNVESVEKELNLLNYLIGKSDVETEFLNLVGEYPKVKKVLPLLLAVRIEKLKEFFIITDIASLTPQDKSSIFDSENIDREELLVFFRSSGLKDIFHDKNVKNLVDYCFGIEVGMDTNARKNRTGTIMERIVGEYLNAFCGKHKHFRLLKQATVKKIKADFELDICMDKSDRRFDFALFNQSEKQIFLIETNYYSSSGSKLKATAGEYMQLNDFLKRQKATLIWITDGKGWLTALNALEETFNHNDYVVNLSMLHNGILNEVLGTRS